MIIPLPDHRGCAIDSVESWTKGQTLECHRYEVLVVGTDHNQGLVADVEKLLGIGDRWVNAPEESVSELYNRGAREAVSPLLFITESHCVGDPKCLEEILRFMIDNPVNGAYCKSFGLPGNKFANMEQRVFEEELERKRGRQNVISVRGSAIDRAWFLESGGFDAEFGHFAEVLLAEELDRRGSRMGFAEKAIVHHANVSQPAHLIESLRDYGEEEVRYASAASRRIRPCAVWEARNEHAGNAARSRVLALLRHSPWIALRQPRSTVALLGQFAQLLPAATAGIRWSSWSSRIRLAFACYRLPLLRARPDRYYNLYLKIWREAIRGGGLRFLAGRAPNEKVPIGAYDLGKADARLVGFHDVEEHPTGSFRWSKPVATIRLGVPPGDYELTLGLVDPPAEIRASLAMFFDNKRVGFVHDEAAPGTIVVRLRVSDFGKGRAHHLTWVCPPSPVDPTVDPRQLGLPVSGFDLRRT